MLNYRINIFYFIFHIESKVQNLSIECCTVFSMKPNCLQVGCVWEFETVFLAHDGKARKKR